MTRGDWEVARANILKSVEAMFDTIKYDDEGRATNPLRITWNRTFTRDKNNEPVPEELVLTIGQKAVEEDV